MITKLFNRIRWIIYNKVLLPSKLQANTFLVKNRTKIFCIGFNKTGTTSIAKALKQLKIVMGHQNTAERLVDDYIIENFTPIINFCKTAEAFQDAPFSYPETYKHLDRAFPNSKFILTVRDNSDQWYNSITKFHGKIWGNGNIPPTANDLKKTNHGYKGRPYKTMKYIYDAPDSDIYNKKILTSRYEQHNKDVINYFKNRPNDFIVINVAKATDYLKLCSFLGREPIGSDFPWENRT